MPSRRRLRSLAAWLLAAGAVTTATGEPLTFDVHFVILTSTPAARQAVTIEQMRREVDILNEFFVTEARAPLVLFRFKSLTPFLATRSSNCRLKDWGDVAAPLDTSRVVELFNACTDPQLRDPRAINFYVYDAYAHGSEFRDATGHGRRNSNRPFVFLDWERLNHGDQAAEEHEMGHAFGLEHICVAGATRRTPTNIMASADCGKGSGGLRNIGFNEEQAAAVLRTARQVADRLR